MLNLITNRKRNCQGHDMRRCLLLETSEGLVNRKVRRGWKRFQTIGGIMNMQKPRVKRHDRIM